jgi:hypothetical protein
MLSMSLWLLKTAVTQTASAAAGYAWNAAASGCRRHICGTVRPTLSADKCYVVVRGQVYEISGDKRYVVESGVPTEYIEDNWIMV